MNTRPPPLIALALLLALAACGGRGGGTVGGPAADYVPRSVKVGKPYSVMGETYVPHADPDYDEVGVASWYGPGFHGKPTATGERFNSKALTAAHRTLPMPSMVRVTDLLTGRSTIVRVNDRGPFSEKRIIDLSEAAANAIGIKGRGLAQVRVQFLPAETERYLASISTPGKPIRYPGLTQEPVLVADAALPAPTLDGYADIQESRNVAAIAPVGAVEENILPPAGGAPLAAVDSRPPPAPTQVLRAPTSLQPLPYRTSAAASDEHEMTPLQGGEYASIPSAPSAMDARVSALSPAVPGFYVQAGSFGISENAEHLAERLNGIGPSFVTQQTVGDRTWYRVRVGPVKTREVAEAMLRDVNVIGLTDARIIEEGS